MRIENYVDMEEMPGASGLFFAVGSFGIVDGNASYERIDENGKTTFVYCDELIRLEAEFSANENGVVIRRDRFINLSGYETEINSLLSRFTLTGNEYEIYTQYNGWQHESTGAWQRLVTQITAASEGIRTCDGATPMMGFHNLYTGKNTVFHLIPNAQWQMTAKKFPQSDRERVVLECGFYDRALHLRVAAGECIELPTVVFFSAKSKTDLDAYKLHEWYNKNYPRRVLPILYNSWLYCFDQLNIDALMKQADCAAEMGFEGFMIDAGWFGKGVDWSSEVGDWEENTVSGPCGRLIELSGRVRERGMIFGLWFEPERAASSSRALAEHPDYYIANTFLDFANPDAIDYMLDVISEQIDKYEIGWLKFDFNVSIPYDPSGNAFYRYMQGQKDFILRLRKRYPEMYITNCASGGCRMELGQGMLFDDFWLSDNQGPYEGIRIVKDTLKRMPSALIQRWNVQKYCEDFPVYPDKKTGRMIHCNDATWDFLIGVQDSFSEAFMKGGPMGFSCDLDAFPTEYKKRWSDVIAQYKQDRDFYKDATARILIDSDGIIVIEYADTAVDRCVLQIFTKTAYARAIVLY
ncbi:MAG: alpha-galactosidase, partial [Clostridia bacterium]|nr:alpha-galactosidase [Clostridia bacterium]